MKSDISQLSEAKHALFEKYLHGELTQSAKAVSDNTRNVEVVLNASRARVVMIQPGEGCKRPFFFLHGNWMGTAFFCFPLARELGSELPFYTLEPYQFDGLQFAPALEIMAKAHIKSMRSVQPEGPYLLGGWCNGGLVAYEMARQLHAAGQKVELLVLIDPMYLGYRTQRTLIRGIISRLGDLMGRGQDEQLDWFLRLLYVCKPLRTLTHGPLLVYRRLRNMHFESSQDSVRLIINDVIHFALVNAFRRAKGFASIFEKGRVAPPHIDSLVPTSKALRQDYLGLIEWIDMGYRPPSDYPGKITFIWPCKEAWHTISSGWRKVAKAKEAQEVEAYIIPGNQDTWRVEHLQVLAERLGMCISKAQKELT